MRACFPKDAHAKYDQTATIRVEVNLDDVPRFDEHLTSELLLPVEGEDPELGEVVLTSASAL